MSEEDLTAAEEPEGSGMSPDIRALIVIAVGAILVWAIRSEPSWLDMDNLGYIVMLLGLSMLVAHLIKQYLSGAVDENRVRRERFHRWLNRLRGGGSAGRASAPADGSPPRSS